MQDPQLKDHDDAVSPPFSRGERSVAKVLHFPTSTSRLPAASSISEEVSLRAASNEAVAPGDGAPSRRRRSPRETPSKLMKGVKLRHDEDDPTWLLRYIKPTTNSPTHKTLGRLSKMTEFEACLKAQEFLTALESGGDPFAGDLAVEQYFDERRLPWAQQHKKSWKDDLGVFNRYVRRKIGQLIMRKVTRRHLQQLIDALHEGAEATTRREKLSEGTIYQVIALLKALFNWAHKNGDIPSNPATSIRQLKLNNQRRERYTAEQLSAIGMHLNDAPPLVRLLFLMLLALGTRIGELLNAKHEDVDERACALYIGKNKADRPIWLPMPPMAMEAYQELKTLRRPGNSYLFPAIRGTGPMSPPRKAFNTVLAAAGIENRIFHDTRRTACSEAINCPGVTLVDVSRALNHSSVRVTESRYLVTGDERIRHALTQSSSRLHAQLHAHQQARRNLQVASILKPTMPSVVIPTTLRMIAA